MANQKKEVSEQNSSETQDDLEQETQLDLENLDLDNLNLEVEAIDERISPSETNVFDK